MLTHTNGHSPNGLEVAPRIDKRDVRGPEATLGVGAGGTAA